MALVFKKEKRKILNPKLLLVALVALIALVALPAFADNEGEGRYKAIPYQHKLMTDYIYILDTVTGDLKICVASWTDKNNYVPDCGKWVKK